jgi:hypothetical protein
MSSKFPLTKHLPNLLTITAITLISTFLLWLPFFLNLKSFWSIPLPPGGMSTVVANFDGPYYIAVAKSLYNPDILNQFEFNLPHQYYAAHYPLYPLTIRFLALFTNYPYAMLASSVIFSVLAAITFYFLIHHLNSTTPHHSRGSQGSSQKTNLPTSNSLLLTTIFLFFPARWLILRSVGSPEPLFLFLVLLSLLSMQKKNYWLAGIAGALAQLTKPPAILLFIAYSLYLILPHVSKLITGNFRKELRNLPWKAYPLLLIPTALISLWYFYSRIFGSFFAYFQSGDNLHLFWPPFQIFNRAAAWVGTFWLEDVLWIYLIIGLGLIFLIKQHHRLLAWLTGIWLTSIFFVTHRDIARYALPAFPLILIAAAPLLENKYTKFLLAILIIPVYLYTINFIAGNAVGISDWTPLL